MSLLYFNNILFYVPRIDLLIKGYKYEEYNYKQAEYVVNNKNPGVSRCNNYL